MDALSLSFRNSGRAILHLCTAAALASVVTACRDGSPLSPAALAWSQSVSSTGNLSMAASDWSFEYSPSMPRHPRTVGSGWQFEFPHKEAVGYLTTAQRPTSASQSITASITVETEGNPSFEYRAEAANTCGGQATVRLYFQRRGDNMSGVGAYEHYRWWSNPVAYNLGSGSVDLIGDLADPSAWTSVLGRSGADNEAAFRAALADLGKVGFTFGGGCFFGHGVYVEPGTGQATFTATAFTVR